MWMLLTRGEITERITVVIVDVVSVVVVAAAAAFEKT